MKKEELINLINLCYEAVIESKLGPIITRVEDKEAFNNLPYNTFLYIIQKIIPTNLSADMLMREPGENWKKPECDH